MKERAFPVLAALLLASLSNVSTAQWGHAPDVNTAVAAGFDTSVFDVAAVTDGAGGFFTAWEERRGSVLDIYAQHVDANGNSTWQVDGLPVCTNTFQQTQPEIVQDGTGGVIIVWADTRIFGDGRHHFYAQRLNAAGEAQWAVDGIRVCTNDAEQEWAGDNRADVISRPGGGAIIVWGDARGRPTANTQLYAQALDLDGNRLHGDDGLAIATDTAPHQDINAVVVSGDDVMIMWRSSFGGMKGTLMSDPGASISVMPDRIGNDGLRAVSDGAGGVVAASVDSFASSGDVGLWVQRIEADLSLPWGADGVRLSENIEDDSSAEVTIAADGTGGAYVAWKTDPGNNDNIYIARVDSGGVSRWTDGGLVVADTDEDEDTPRLLADADGVYVVWRTRSDEFLRVQRYNMVAAPRWPSPIEFVTQDQSNDVEDLNLVSDNADGLIACFRGSASKSSLDMAAKRLLADGTLPKSRLLNVSTRGFVGVGEEQLIAGFVIAGVGKKRVLIRGVGPTLGVSPFGLAGVIENPKLELLADGGAEVAENDDWGAASNAAEIATTTDTVGAFSLIDGSADAVILIELDPGAYTAVVGGVENATGIAIVEVYDADPASDDTRLVNVSTRGVVGMDDSIIIPGYVISGNATMRMLIRAVGPTLASLGVQGAILDPQLEIVSGGVEIGSNNNWGTPSIDVMAIQDSTTHTGAFGLDSGSDDAAIVVILGQGSFTVPTSGVDGGTGVGLVEAYESF